MNEVRAVTLAAAISLAVIAGIHGAGTTTGDFLLADISAREASLGGIYSPGFARVTAATANPAALYGVDAPQFYFSHFTSVFATNFEQVIYAQQSAKGEWLSFFGMYAGNADLYRTDSQGVPIESIENYDVLLGGAYAREITGDMAAGVNVKLTASRMYKSSVYGAAANIGVLHRNFEKRYIVGASLENIGMTSEYKKEKSLFPVLFRAGYGIHVFKSDTDRVTLFVEEKIFLVEYEGSETSVGVEATYNDFFSGRAGYIFGRDEGRIAIGAGAVYGNVRVDYCYQPFFSADNAHRITLGLRF